MCVYVVYMCVYVCVRVCVCTGVCIDRKCIKIRKYFCLLSFMVLERVAHVFLYHVSGDITVNKMC